MKIWASPMRLQNIFHVLNLSIKCCPKPGHLPAIPPHSLTQPRRCLILEEAGSTWSSALPPGSLLHRRGFSCEEVMKVSHKGNKTPSVITSELLYTDLLRAEQENWNKNSARYKSRIKRIKRKLEELHDKYTLNLSSPMIRFGENVYFEDNGCIFLSKAGDADKASVLFSTEDLGFSDAHIQRIRISPDQRYMAVSLKSENSEEATCVVVKLDRFPVLEKVIPNSFSFEWATSDVLFYTIQKNLKCQEVFMTSFTDEKHTKLVYSEQDARFFVDIYCTKDRRFLTINSNSKTTSEVWLVDCSHPFKSPVLVQARTKGVIYHVEHRNDELYILTTYGEPAEYKLMKAPVASSGMENWQLFYALEEKTKLIDLEMFSNHCVMFLQRNRHLCLDVISFLSHSVQSIKLPTWACAFELESHPEHSTSTCYFQLTSPVQPPKRFAYSFKANNLIEQAEQEVPIIKNCHTTRLLAKSKDETSVPITVFHNTKSKELHRKPLLVHVYGAYGIDLNMSFKEEKLMLIEEGWILAYCHVRGGGELGLSWHKDGCQHKKLKGLHDLQACITLLHELGFSQPKSTAVAAASAGGVLAGALCNTDPELIRAVVLQPYPSVFITAYENDQRVPLTGILRYVQKLRKAARDYASRTERKGNWTPNIILDVQARGSHCDASWEDSLKQVARHIAFLSKELDNE
ncbi:prolyl endopeptidase-like isoform X2 [Nothoprocta perdicaria]|uniref:prolyl endopeptidase-like isoform X2 n=1 Tax=Nothoprocta perdicaria TaxID=30464 RepID=UPI000E1BCF9B|nr:prolyl endopeptidase-like isoform X2 [Nothoprocta perdicaria]